MSWSSSLCSRSCQEGEEQLLLPSNMSLPAPSSIILSRRSLCTNVTASRSRKLTCWVTKASSTCTSPQDVQQLWKLAGRKYGHDLSSEGRQKVETHLDNVQQGVQQLDLTGTSWKLAYTTSQGQSGGRVGPFIGDVTQVSVLKCSNSFVLPSIGASLMCSMQTYCLLCRLLSFELAGEAPRQYLFLCADLS